jgi:hypothetical protein
MARVVSLWSSPLISSRSRHKLSRCTVILANASAMSEFTPICTSWPVQIAAPSPSTPPLNLELRRVWRVRAKKDGSTNLARAEPISESRVLAGR